LISWFSKYFAFRVAVVQSMAIAAASSASATVAGATTAAAAAAATAATTVTTTTTLVSVVQKNPRIYNFLIALIVYDSLC
jgi:ABC-type spermidine/putrescine transport system permease subunit II